MTAYYFSAMIQAPTETHCHLIKKGHLMRTVIKFIALFLLLWTSFAYAATTKNTSSYLITTYKQTKLTPTQILHRLQAGNTRYINGKAINYNQRQLSKLASQKGQAPYAFILSCIDSRSVPEEIFNQPIGALFVSRIAGNVISKDVLGSMEFATKYAGTKLIIIMGHTQCGAVIGACKGVNKPKNLAKLLSKITPAVNEVDKEHNKTNLCNNPGVIDAMAKQNVLNQIKALYKKSPAIAKLAKEGKVKVIGVLHNIRTGKVTFFNEKGREV